MLVQPLNRLWRVVKGNFGFMEQLMGLVCDQLVADVIFVFKIQVEGTLCNSRLFHNVGDGCGVDALCDKEVVGAVKERLFFLFFILVNFPHYIR